MPTFAFLVVGILARPSEWAAKFSKRMKRSSAIAALVATVILAGNMASAQVAPPFRALSQVPVPEPDNFKEFVKDKTAAIALGKALFWDMQVGSDGITACASCHFHAGVDNRAKNQINPGLNRVNADNSKNPDTTFTVGKPNYTLKPQDFPTQSNDVVSSQGVFNSEFVDVIPGRAEDVVNYKPDQDGFQVGSTNVRHVEPRNTPTVINAVFNFRNFWDGRAQNDFNGVNEFGSRDPNTKVYRARNPAKSESASTTLP